MEMKNLEKAAPPLELLLKGGDPNKVVLYGCGTCHRSTATRQEALECCVPYVCEDCGAEYKSYCEPCGKKKSEAKEQAIYDKAKKVSITEYSGQMLYCDHCYEYFWDLDTFLDDHADQETIPDWVWGTTQHGLKLDAEDIVCRQLENDEFYEGAGDSIPKESIAEMQSFFNGWLVKNPLDSYEQDCSTVVNIEKEVEEYLKERHAAEKEDVPKT